MENTMLIQVTNQKAFALLHELEELHLIKVIQTNSNSGATKLSNKYRGSITRNQGVHLNEHIKQMRSEWNSI